MIKNALIVGYQVSQAQYSAEDKQRGDPGFTVRSHVITEFLRCPQRWVRGYVSPKSAAKDWGSLYDCLLLSPDEFEARYAIPLETYRNEKTGKDVKWKMDMRVQAVADWVADNEGKTPTTKKLYAAAEAAVLRLHEDKLISELIATSRHQCMIVAEWHDPATGLVIPLKCLIDIVPPNSHPTFGGSVWDSKTTRNAAPRPFAADAQKFGYHIQGRFYLDMWNAASGEQRGDFGHVVQENYAPYEYRTPPPLMSQRFLDFGRLCYQSALARYCQSLKTGVWPSYDPPGTWPITDCADWFLDPSTVYAPMPEEDEDEEAEGESETAPEEEPGEVVP